MRGGEACGSRGHGFGGGAGHVRVPVLCTLISALAAWAPIVLQPSSPRAGGEVCGLVAVWERRRLARLGTGSGVKPMAGRRHLY